MPGCQLGISLTESSPSRHCKDQHSLASTASLQLESSNTGRPISPIWGDRSCLGLHSRPSYYALEFSWNEVSNFSDVRNTSSGWMESGVSLIWNYPDFSGTLHQSRSLLGTPGDGCLRELDDWMSQFPSLHFSVYASTNFSHLGWKICIKAHGVFHVFICSFKIPSWYLYIAWRCAFQRVRRYQILFFFR